MWSIDNDVRKKMEYNQHPNLKKIFALGLVMFFIGFIIGILVGTYDYNLDCVEIANKYFIENNCMCYKNNIDIKNISFDFR